MYFVLQIILLRTEARALIGWEVGVGGGWIFIYSGSFRLLFLLNKVDFISN